MSKGVIILHIFRLEHLFEALTLHLQKKMKRQTNRAIIHLYFL